MNLSEILKTLFQCVANKGEEDENRQKAGRRTGFGTGGKKMAASEDAGAMLVKCAGRRRLWTHCATTTLDGIKFIQFIQYYNF